MKLYAPKLYWIMNPVEIDSFTGGCGPGGFGDYLIPDTMYGLSVKPACRIHDFMYHFGDSLKDKEEADRVFLNNMIRIINDKTRSRILKFLRYRRARAYYLAVKWFGAPAFWDGKNPDEDFQEHEDQLINSSNS